MREKRERREREEREEREGEKSSGNGNGGGRLGSMAAPMELHFTSLTSGPNCDLFIGRPASVQQGRSRFKGERGGDIKRPSLGWACNDAPLE